MIDAEPASLGEAFASHLKEGYEESFLGANSTPAPSQVKVSSNYCFKPFTFEKLVISENGRPSERSGHRIACNDCRLWSFGGYYECSEEEREDRNLYGRGVISLQSNITNTAQYLFCQLHSFNFARQQWTEELTSGEWMEYPLGLVSHTAALHGNHFIVFGGTRLPFGAMSFNSLHVCDLRKKVWTRFTTFSGNGPQELYGHAMLLDETNKFIYVVGGTSGNTFFIDVYKLDLTSGAWEALFVSQGDIQTEVPAPRYRHEIAFDGKFIYILGGGGPEQSVCRDSFISIPVFNVNTRKWSVKESVGDEVHLYPAPRKCHGLVQAEGIVTISGGENGDKIFDDIWRLNLANMKWSMLPTRMPTKLSFHSVCLSPQGCMYIFGGVYNLHPGLNYKDRTNSTHKIWLGIPKLKEICWEALLLYDKSVKTLSKDQLIVMGIPTEFIDRLA